MMTIIIIGVGDKYSLSDYHITLSVHQAMHLVFLYSNYSKVNILSVTLLGSNQIISMTGM